MCGEPIDYQEFIAGLSFWGVALFELGTISVIMVGNCIYNIKPKGMMNTINELLGDRQEDNENE